MQAAILPFSAGWQWINDGIRLFRRQPMAMFFWSLITGLLISLTYIIPLFGQMALIAAMPSLTFIVLNACRNIENGRQIMPGMWLEPLRDTQARKGLFRLGLAYLAACLLGGFVATVPFLDTLMAAVDTEGQIDAQALAQAVQGPFVTFAIMYVVISALFWHAPALVGWHGIKMTQALFFSMVACWRNKWPFLLYGASWGGIFFAMQFIDDLLTGIGLSQGVAQLLMTPVNLLVAAVLYCSFYPTYMSVFGNNYRQEIAATGTH